MGPTLGPRARGSSGRRAFILSFESRLIDVIAGVRWGEIVGGGDRGRRTRRRRRRLAGRGRAAASWPSRAEVRHRAAAAASPATTPGRSGSRGMGAPGGWRRWGVGRVAAGDAHGRRALHISTRTAPRINTPHASANKQVNNALHACQHKAQAQALLINTQTSISIYVVFLLLRGLGRKRQANEEACVGC